METFDAIMSRRSVRQYTNQSISKELIDKLLQAGMNAPSAGNQQAWHFIVVTDRARLDRIAESLPYGGMCREAQAAIVCCFDETLESQKGMAVQDVSAATQNIWLTAHDAGLGAVWLAVYPREEREEKIRTAFAISSKTIVPVSVVALGYPKVRPDKVVRFKLDRVHYNGW